MGLQEMQLNEARSVKWSFEEFNGQAIGDLLDNGKITLRDLGEAVERSYHPEVREASRILLVHALSQRPNKPTSTTAPLNVITSEYRSFAERRQIQFAMLEGALLGVVMGMSILFFIQILISNAGNEPIGEQSSALMNSPQGILAVVIVLLLWVGILILFFRILNWMTDRIDDQIRLHRKGQRGEEHVLNAMFHALDSKWWLFRNLELPGRKSGDVDLVLVGKNGVWALEVKAYGGEYRTVGERWEIRLGGRWINTFKNPSRQAKRNATALSQILTSHNVKQWVNPAVVWANQDSKLTIENPSVSIWRLDNLNMELEKMPQKRPMSDYQVNRIVEIFKGLYQEPFRSSETLEGDNHT